MIPDRVGQVWESLNSDRELTLFLFLHVNSVYRYGRNAMWNDWVALDLTKGTTCMLHMWRAAREPDRQHVEVAEGAVIDRVGHVYEYVGPGADEGNLWLVVGRKLSNNGQLWNVLPLTTD